MQSRHQRRPWKHERQSSCTCRQYRQYLPASVRERNALPAWRVHATPRSSPVVGHLDGLLVGGPARAVHKMSHHRHRALHGPGEGRGCTSSGGIAPGRPFIGAAGIGRWRRHCPSKGVRHAIHECLAPQPSPTTDAPRLNKPLREVRKRLLLGGSCFLRLISRQQNILTYVIRG